MDLHANDVFVARVWSWEWALADSNMRDDGFLDRPIEIPDRDWDLGPGNTILRESANDHQKANARCGPHDSVEFARQIQKGRLVVSNHAQ